MHVPGRKYSLAESSHKLCGWCYHLEVESKCKVADFTSFMLVNLFASTYEALEQNAVSVVFQAKQKHFALSYNS